MELDYRGCQPGFELSKFKPSFHYKAEQNHVSNVLAGVMAVTYVLLHQHCVTTLGFKRSAKPNSDTNSNSSRPG